MSARCAHPAPQGRIRGGPRHAERLSGQPVTSQRVTYAPCGGTGRTALQLDGRSDAEGRCRQPDAALLYLEAGAWAEEATKVVRRERIGLRYPIMRIYMAE
jgi:hypothetical protein